MKWGCIILDVIMSLLMNIKLHDDTLSSGNMCRRHFLFYINL